MRRMATGMNDYDAYELSLERVKTRSGDTRLEHLYKANAETEVCVIGEDEAAGEQNTNG